MSFKRKYAPQWADVASLIDQMEQLLTRHKVPLAVVDGGQLADVAIASLDGVSREDMIACIENQDQVSQSVSPSIRYLVNERMKERWGEGTSERERELASEKYRSLFFFSRLPPSLPLSLSPPNC